jgi:hypothetical protein
MDEADRVRLIVAVGEYKCVVLISGVWGIRIPLAFGFALGLSVSGNGIKIGLWRRERIES